MKRIRYCSKCEGHPYYIVENEYATPFFCSFCSSELIERMVDDSVLKRDYIAMESYEETNSNQNAVTESHISNENMSVDNWIPSETSIRVPVYDTEYQSEPSGNVYISPNAVRGVVRRKIADASFHRYYLQKMFEKIVYKQRMSDVLNIFYITLMDDSDNAIGDEVSVRIHGDIEGGIESIYEGCLLTANGKYSAGQSNEFIASEIYVNGNSKRVKYEKDDFLVWLVPIIGLAVVMGVVAMFSDTDHVAGESNFLETIKLFLILSGGAVLTVYGATRRSLKQMVFGFRKIPFKLCFWAGLIIGLVLTFIFKDII